jgi:hypothetical protein
VDNNTKFRNQQRPGQAPEVPIQAEVRGAEIGRPVIRAAPKLGAQVYSTFDARPIGGRDFRIEVPATVQGADIGETGLPLRLIATANVQVPRGSIAVLRRVAVQWLPDFEFPGLGPVYSLLRNNAPIPNFTNFHAQQEPWIDTYALFAQTDVMGLIGIGSAIPDAATPNAPIGGEFLGFPPFGGVNPIWGSIYAQVTFAGALLLSSGRPLPLEVGHRAPLVRTEPNTPGDP